MQEFLNVNGLELEIKKDIFSGEAYVKVVGGQKEISDADGIAGSIQNGWHK